MVRKYNPIIQSAQFLVSEMVFAVNDFKDSIGNILLCLPHYVN